MAITVGTDTYVTTAEADTYIENHYVSTDTQRTTWEALTDTDKEIYLRNATIALNDIPYRGIKYDSDQTLSFPRCYKSWVKNGLPYYKKWTLDCNYYCETDVPDDIKYAQIHEALENASPSSDSDIYNSMNGNIKSFSITGLSETAQTVSSGTNGIIDVLFSRKAQRLVTKYVGGGYAIH